MYPKTTKTHIIPGAEVKLHTLFYPNPGAETVLLLHGGPGTPDPMPLVAGLLADNYQVLYFDQRGCGKSVCTSQSEINIETLVADISAVLEYFDLKKVHIFGHSWGGLLAQLFADQHPKKVKSLFLCSAAPGTGMQWRQMEMEMFFFAISRTSPLEWPMQSFLALQSKMGVDAGAQKLFQTFHGVAHRGFPAQAPADKDVMLIKAATTNQIRNSILAHPGLQANLSADFPVTITYSSQDTDFFKLSRQVVYNRFPKSTRIFIPNAGHFPWMHNLPGFTKALGEHFILAKKSAKQPANAAPAAGKKTATAA